MRRSRADEPTKRERAWVPSFANGFFGRDRELDRIAEWFGGTERVVTICGPGGIGKTRLTCEYAARHDGEVCFADLSAARDLDGLCAAVSDALGAEIHGSAEAAVASLARQFERHASLLFIADNVEQVIEPAARALARWSAAAPNVRWLVTTRERLRIEREIVLELGPLETGTGASALLLERAARVHAMSEAPRDVARLAGAIVERLEGVPLAIELAAARLAVLSPEDLLARLDQMLSVLSRSGRSSTTRAQRTLRDTIAWSWNLLDAVEQTALAQCTVFPSDFTLDAAEAVLDLGPDAPAVMDVVHSLRDKSLVRVRSTAGAQRLGLYAAVREYASQQLAAAGGEKSVRDRHALHYARKVASYADEARTRDGIRARVRLKREAPNALASLAWGVECATGPDGAEAVARSLRTAASFEIVTSTMGGLDRFAALIGDLLATRAASEVPASLRGAALLARGAFRATTNDAKGSTEDLEQARAIAVAAGDRRAEADVLGRMAELHARFTGREQGVAALNEALAIFRALDDSRGISATLVRLGGQLSELGRFDEALAALAEALPMCERGGEPWLLARALLTQSQLFAETGNLLEADAASTRAAALYGEGDELPVYSEVLRGLIYHACGRLELARDQLTRMCASPRARDQMYGGALLYLGAVLVDLGQLEAAATKLTESAVVLRSTGEPRYAALAQGWSGALEARAGRIEQAEHHFATAESALTPNDPFRRSIGVLRVAIDLARATSERDAVHRESANKRLAASPSQQPIEERVVRRAAARWIEASEPTIAAAPRAERSASSSKRVEAVDRGLTIHSKGHWFQLPSGRVVDLQKRQAIRRLLVRLAEGRRDDPGRAVSVDALVEAGWPASRVRSDVVRRRLVVSVARLRLRDCERS